MMIERLQELNPWRRVVVVAVVLVLLAVIFNLVHDTLVMNFIPVQYHRLVGMGIRDCLGFDRNVASEVPEPLSCH